MKKHVKLMCAMLALMLMMTLTGCGGGGEGGTGEAGGGAVSTASPEEYFLWDENIIYGLTEEGKTQETLVIPAKCEGIDTSFKSEKVKHISFESDKDLSVCVAFAGCSALESVGLPAELTTIDDAAFLGCSALQSITIPANVKTIEKGTFENLNSLTSVVFEGNIEEIQDRAFRWCKNLTTINLPDSITTIGEKAFYECESLKVITLPAGLKTLGKDAFLNGGLTDVNVPEGLELTDFEGGAFIQAARGINVHVVEGSWMDTHFEEVFSGGDAKDYTFVK